MISKIKSLKNHKGFMKYLKNTSWLFAEKILRIITGLFVGIWVARYLGPEKFGVFSYANSFVGLFSTIATLGLDGILVRELVKNEERQNELIGTAFWLKLMGAVAVIIILAIAVNFTSNDSYTNKLVFIIASATIFQSFNVIDIYFQSKVLSKYVVFANIISLFISSLIKIILILNNAPLIDFVLVIVFDSFVLACGYLYFYIKQSSLVNIKKWKFKFDVALSLLKDSWPFILSSMVIAIYMKIDQVMIKEMMNSEAVGQYSAAVRLSEAWYFIPMVISSSLFPAIINAKKESEELYYSRLQNLYNLIVWIALAIAIPMMFFSDWVVDFLYGNQYNQVGSVLKIHIWAGIFVGLLYASGRFLIVENLSKQAFYRNFVGAISNIFLNIYFIKHYGIKGAAWSTLISYMIAGFIYDFFDKKTRRSFYLKLNSLNIIKNIKGKK